MIIPVPRQPSVFLDRFASAWAMACAVHCIALPLVLFAISPLYLALYSFEAPYRRTAMTLLRLISLEPWFILASAIISGTALARGLWRHRRPGPAVLGVAGISLLVLAWFKAELFEGWAHTIGVLAGGSLLAMAHVRNARLLRRRHRHRR
jgi:hypothetical protein